MRISDWSSYVCSSDLAVDVRQVGRCHPHLAPHLAVLKRGRQSVLLHVVEEVAHGLLGEIVEIGHLLETVEQIRRVKIGPVGQHDHEIGRASCRERGCEYVENWVVAGSLKTKKK